MGERLVFAGGAGMTAAEVEDLYRNLDPEDGIWGFYGPLPSMADDVSVGTWHASAEHVFVTADGVLFPVAVPEVWHEREPYRGASAYISALVRGDVTL